MYRCIAFIILLFLFSSSLRAQTVIIDEDFGDGDFTNNPAWTDSEGKHIVNASNLLQLNAPSTTDEAVISTSSSAAYGEWEALINLDFNPSSSNLARFYIISDTESMKGDVNGYYIQVGDTDDEVSLYHQDGSTSTKIIDGTDGLVDSNPVSIRVRATRDINGNWELLADTTGGTTFTSQGTATDNTYTTSNFIGLFSDYTSTRSTLFEYDDIVVTKISPPLEIQDVNVVDNQTLDVTFNLDLDPASVDAIDFSVDNSVGNPNSTSLPSSNIVRLSYNSALASNRYTLNVNNVDDSDGNTINSNSTIGFTLFGTFAPGDIIINEFMYDPPGGQAEYVELRNTSGKILNLQNWEIGDEGGTDVISANNVVLEPDSFVVISADTVSLFNVYGNRPFVDMGALASLNNGGDVIQINTDTGAQADSLRYAPKWGGNNIALERRSATAPSVFQENFGDSPNPLGGTPGITNQVADDTTPPDLIDLGIPGNQTLELAFSERLENSAAENTNNFTLNNGIIISNAQRFAADSVRLSLASALQNGTNYLLIITNQQDIFGNTTGAIDTSFTFFEISDADSGEVFINEFTYDPPSGSTEYVELHNPTSKSFDLNGWTLNDNTGSRQIITNSQTVLPPDSFIVLAPDQTLLNSFPDINLVTMGSNFPSLNNGGDNIVIRRADGILLDSLTYDSDYGGNNIAIERRTTDVSGNFPENFGDAPNGFGTPGSANEIAPDQTAPTFDQLVATGNTTFQLVFSENLDSNSATDANNYTISPGRNIQLISANQDTVVLYVDPALQSGTTYDVTVNNIKDIFGNTLNNASRNAEYLELTGAQPGDLRINEILYSRASGGGPEFVEIYNPSTKNIDLSGWVIGDASGTADLGPGTQLQAGEYLVLTDNINFANSLSNGQFVSNFPSLNDSGDDIYIRTDQDVTIDSVAYSESWGGGNPGESLERIDPLAASNDAHNFGTSTAPTGNTAGAENSIFEVDQEAPRIVFAKSLSNGNIEVQFNEFIQLTQNLLFNAGGATLAVINFDPDNGNIIELSASKSASALTIIAQNISDVRGNVTASDEIPVAQKLNPAEIVINEILFNPLSDSDDNLPDQNEYIELRNTTDAAVSLEGIFIHDAPDENEDVRSIIPVSTQAKWIPAQGVVLIYADEAQRFENSQTARFFGLSSIPVSSLIRADRSSLSLASSGDAIYLADSTGATVDSVFYDESWHNPNLVDTRGIALERINPGGPSDEQSNWSSSTNAKGGSPSQENTIFQVPQNQPQQTGITFDPNPFSPDDDGTDDNLFINYKLDQPDYLIKVQIYDRYGRLVKELADGTQAGFEGTLTWNGRKDDGTRNRIGIYIVIFEAFNSNNGSDKTFKETVVLARRLR